MKFLQLLCLPYADQEKVPTYQFMLHRLYNNLYGLFPTGVPDLPA